MLIYRVTNFGRAQTVPTPVGDMQLNRNYTLELDDSKPNDGKILKCLKEWPGVHVEPVAETECQCPDCGGVKSKTAKRCMACFRAEVMSG